LKLIETLRKLGVTSEESGLKFLDSSLRHSLKFWDWFVDWNSVFANAKRHSQNLKIWNQLIGTSDFESDCSSLLEQNPQIAQSIPALLVREGSGSTKFSLVQDISDLTLGDLEFDFSKPATTEDLRKSTIQFMIGTGLSKLFTSGTITNLNDYLVGVEAGLNSNARKNRSGTSMETVVEAFLNVFCKQHPSIKYLSQATTTEIKREWNIEIGSLGEGRRFDFAISDGRKLVLMEVNLYNSAGSKLDSIARSYPELEGFVKEAGHTFVWVTDGPGWKKSLSSLGKAFGNMDHLWNLEVLYAGALNDVFGVRTKQPD
jgi:type II restriction enzyme